MRVNMRANEHSHNHSTFTDFVFSVRRGIATGDTAQQDEGRYRRSLVRTSKGNINAEKCIYKKLKKKNHQSLIVSFTETKKEGELYYSGKYNK